MWRSKTGLSFAELFYPSYRYRGPRTRTLAFGRRYSRQEPQHYVVTTEHGEVASFPLTADGYEAFVTWITRERVTVISPFGRQAAGAFPYLPLALHDTRARLMAHEKRGIVGVAYRVGRSHATVISEGCWHREALSDACANSDARFLHTLRQVMGEIEVGTHDTAAALGTASLRRFYHDTEMRSLMRLPSSLTEMLEAHRYGGRVQDNGVGKNYAALFEADIRSAYPSVVSHGLPWGNPGLVTRREDAEDKPLFASYRIVVHRAIPNSPIPVRSAERGGKKLSDTVSYRLDVREYRYCGWSFEVAPLEAMGSDIVEVFFEYGYVWPELRPAFGPWVDGFLAARERLAASGEDDAALLVKIALNAAIGKWGISDQPLEILDTKHSFVEDRFVGLDLYGVTDPEETDYDAYFHRKVEEGKGKVTPLHWLSYIRAVVRMEVYRIQQREEAHGNPVVIVNCDGVYCAATYADVADSIFTWKFSFHCNAQVPYSRAIVSVKDGQPYSALPGTPRSERGTIMARGSPNG